MATSLSTLLTPIQLAQINNSLLAFLKQNQFPVQDWEPGSVTATMVLAFATALQDFATNLIPVITAGELVDYATGTWLDLLSEQRFGIKRQPAINTIGQLVFDTTASNAGPYTITAGELLIQFNSTGNIYTNQDAYTIAQGAKTTLNFVSQFPNNSLATPPLNYNDATNFSSATGGITLLTSLPGIVITNPSVPISSSTFVQSGSGTGTIVPSAYTNNGDSANIVITITSTGQSGSVSWSYSVNNQNAITGTSASFTITFGGSSVTFTLTNSSNNPSFIEQDTYTINLPTSWIITQGRDQQTDASLQQQDKEVWGFSSGLATNSNLDLLVRQASNQVVLTDIFTDGYINNKINIVVAGQGGIVLSSPTISSIQSYVQARVEITDLISILSPVQTNITIAANIFVITNATTPSLTQITQNVNDAITEYLGTININGTIRVSELITTICNIAGVSYVNIGSVLINGANSDLVLGNNMLNNFQVINFSTLNFTGITYSVS
jgi:hypothetical protein